MTMSSDASEKMELWAIDARQAGEFEVAGKLFALAASECESLRRRLTLQVRQACCLLALHRHGEAAALAGVIARHARDESLFPELVEALGILVDHHLHAHRMAEAAHLLSEAAYVLDQLPDDPANYQVVHNMAVSYAHCGFVVPAIELFDRAVHLATNPEDRRYACANLSAAYHLASLLEGDPHERTRLIDGGLVAATGALDPEGDIDAAAITSTVAHRALMLAEIGLFDDALADAVKARGLAAEYGLREEEVLAMSGQAIALWGSTRNTDVLQLIHATLALADEIDVTDYLEPLHHVEVDVLWALGRYTDARIALERNLGAVKRRTSADRAVRWKYVQLGVEHLRVEALSESDPLTGLANRRHLARLLPTVLDAHPPVCVGIIDLDGFKRINDDFGYHQGDSVLQEVAGLLTRVLRRGDAAVRLGGDEFVMVLRNSTPDDARRVFERLRHLIAHRVWEGLPSEVGMTASIGVSVGNRAADSAHVLTDAIGALRWAKKLGRDRITFH